MPPSFLKLGSHPMTHPKTAWKFKAWTEAMLRNATVGTPDYEKRTRANSRGMAGTTSRKKRHRRKKRRKNAKKEA